ncbi:hypothetical protein BGZ99_006472 [Dissophora globulifera]|uniref:Uncharacterized protein n=1 Tax=Dissophora globulifera TaxID=979702 RepID=A0A9P6RWA1_9FUNG|nr:hypothetical protein BGZ99_006472 [Dissophora globulifera]
MVSIRIAKKLRTRPDLSDLVDRGLIPGEMFMNEDELEAKRKWRVYRQQQGQTRNLTESSLDGIDNIRPSLDSTRHGLQQYHYDQSYPFDTPKAPMLLAGITVSHSERLSSTISNTSGPERMASRNSYSCRPRRQKKSISMALVPKIELLRKAMDRDRLSRLFQKRPSPAELNQSPKTATVLQAHHLIAFSTTSPDLVPLTAQLNFLLKGERLSHWLYRRPSLAVILNERHILKTEVRTAWMVCPGVSKKVKFYESLIQESRAYREQYQALMIQLQGLQHQHKFQQEYRHQRQLQHQAQDLRQQHLMQTVVA